MTTVNLKNAVPVQVDRHQFSNFAPTYIFHKKLSQWHLIITLNIAIFNI